MSRLSAILFIALTFGIMAFLMYAMWDGNRTINDRYMFSTCLQYKQNYDLCKKEVYGK